MHGSIEELYHMYRLGIENKSMWYGGVIAHGLGDSSQWQAKHDLYSNNHKRVITLVLNTL